MSDVRETLDQAVAAVAGRDWEQTHARLAAADADQPLDAEDLERLAISAFLTGRDETAEDGWARAHQAFLSRGAFQAAFRCAFWLGLVLVTGRGDEARGGGWLARAQRLVAEHALDDGVAHGYLRLPTALGHLDHGDPAHALAAFREAGAVGERFADDDLTVLARLGQGQALLRLGQASRGMTLLDEVLVTLGAGQASPLTAGIVYCGGILACQHVFDLQRAQQWTADLSRWCAAQPTLVPFRGECLVHRAELAQLRGDWDEAAAEADRACRWLAETADPAAGMAHYQRAELHRLRGEHDAAAAAFEQAAALGHDPHPGLALLWLDQGRTAAAAAASRRIVDERPGALPGVVEEVRGPRPRAAVLAAHVRIMLAADDLDAARVAAEELAATATDLGTRWIAAVAAEARGAVLLAEDQAASALEALTHARGCWQQLPAPYEAARTRALLARALQALGDADTAALELAAARRAFAQVGAAWDLARLEGAPGSRREPAAGLTARELEVIRLVAAGHTNREIAERLVISDKTVARHLHNVFTKLDLPNRSAATAYAFEHGLV